MGRNLAVNYLKMFTFWALLLPGFASWGAVRASPLLHAPDGCEKPNVVVVMCDSFVSISFLNKQLCNLLSAPHHHLSPSFPRFPFGRAPWMAENVVERKLVDFSLRVRIQSLVSPWHHSTTGVKFHSHGAFSST